MLSTDYLIVGSGAVGMIFADQLLTETDARIVLVDRHHAPGGHWNDAYPFVRLHQPSAFYGVGSRDLGTGRIDEAGFNAGYHELASGAEVLSYFDELMRERFLPSRRVEYFPMCDYLGEGRFVSRLSGETRQVAYRKLVDAAYFKTQSPSTHTPTFEVAEGVRLVAPNDLPRTAPEHSRYVIVGGGKTAMDVGVWLLQMGADPAAISWIVPRDSWIINREMTQPGELFMDRLLGGQAATLEAAACATSMDDLFDRLEVAGQLLRIDTNVRPTMFRGATISMGEVEMLRRIKDVVRQGRVRRIGRDAVVLDQGVMPSHADALYIDCSAKAFTNPPEVPIFAGDRITVQMVRANLVSFSAALIAHVEAAYEDDAAKNALCEPVTTADTTLDWLRQTLADLRTSGRWAKDPALRQWAAAHRLSGFGIGGRKGPVSAEMQAIQERLKAARGPAEANLVRLLAGESHGPASAMAEAQALS